MASANGCARGGRLCSSGQNCCVNRQFYSIVS
ncbi:Uncharacterised protein [Vibrio cholerae]|nr:Uncharacterised protein [Vibrio cholerae]